MANGMEYGVQATCIIDILLDPYNLIALPLFSALPKANDWDFRGTHVGKDNNNSHGWARYVLYVLIVQ